MHRFSTCSCLTYRKQQSGSYEWGRMCAIVQIGATPWRTALMPKNSAYLVPLKDKVRRAEEFNEGDTVSVRLDIG